MSGRGRGRGRGYAPSRGSSFSGSRRGGSYSSGYHPRSRGGGRGGYSDHRESYQPHYSNRGFGGSSMRSSRSSDNLLSHLGPKAQLELTKALVASVLKTGESRGGRGFREGRSSHYHPREFRHDERSFHDRDDERPMRERRTFSDHRRYDKDFKEGHFERNKPMVHSGSKYRPDKYGFHEERKPDFYNQSSPTFKRQRIDFRGSFRGTGKSYQFSRESRIPYQGRESHYQKESFLPSREKEDNRREKVEAKLAYQKEMRHKDAARISRRDHMEKESSVSSGRIRSRELSQKGDEKDIDITPISGDEEEFGNRRKLFHSTSSTLYVKLQCPHCPNQQSVRFKDYKYHLGGMEHQNNMKRLVDRQSVVLWKIRLIQRKEQRDIEDRWGEEKPEEHKNAVTKFCNICKLAFKCPGDDVSFGINEHNISRYHKMQTKVLNSKCELCKMKLPSRLVYEHHLASIRHLRCITERNRRESYSSEDDKRDCSDKDDFDMSNFVTMDAVGEDEDEEMLSEHEEITGKMEDVEAALKEAEEDDGGSDCMHKRKRISSKDLADEDSYAADEDDEYFDSKNLSYELNVEEFPEEDDYQHKSGDGEALGTEYLLEMEALFCRLCRVAVRIDTCLGTDAIRRHCVSAEHISLYHEELQKIQDDEQEDENPRKHDEEDEEYRDDIHSECEEDFDAEKIDESQDSKLEKHEGENKDFREDVHSECKEDNDAERKEEIESIETELKEEHKGAVVEKDDELQDMNTEEKEDNHTEAIAEWGEEIQETLEMINGEDEVEDPPEDPENIDHNKIEDQSENSDTKDSVEKSGDEGSDRDDSFDKGDIESSGKESVDG